MSRAGMLRWLVPFAFLLQAIVSHAQGLDLVIANGRVMDPESGLDAVLNVGVRGGRVEVLSTTPLFGAQQIDASGLVVAPGFINLHWHGTDPHSDYYQAMDGITASFELEVGVADVDRWYDERAGRMPIHYGASIGHAPVRMRVMNDPGELLPAGDAARKPATPQDLEQ